MKEGGTVDSGGELNLSGGANSIAAAVVNGGHQLLGGTVNVDGNARFTAATEFDATATVNLSAVGDVLHLAGDAMISTGASFSGNGRLVNQVGNSLTAKDNASVGVMLENRGTISIGSSPGKLEAAGFTQSSSGTLDIEITGDMPGEVDLLTVADNVNLSGTIDVSLIGPFEPELGDTFTIVESLFGNVVGTFSTTLLPVFGDLTFDVIYQPQSVLLEVVDVLPGDYNNDGEVNVADYTVWRDNLGAPNGTLPNDPNSGLIGTAQYDTWKTNFGQTVAGAGTASPANVPEPMSMHLAIAASLVAWARRRIW